MTPQELEKKNKRIALYALLCVCLMVGLSFASVPLYRLFCQVTGFGGTPQVGADGGPRRVVDRDITVRFNADVARGMVWNFRPDQPSIKLKIGQDALVSFTANNPTDKPVDGTALFNVLPEAAGKYFHKVQCFCFNRQTLAPGQTAHMPVSFYVDPAILDEPDIADIDTITLSYTYFHADSPDLDRALQKMTDSGYKK